MIYMFEFADMIKLNMGCPLDNEAKMDGKKYWVEFLLKGLPLEYRTGRL